MNKSSVFTRIMLGGILPTVLIFASVIMLIGNAVYTTGVNSETSMAILRAEQTTQYLSGRFSHLPNLLNLTSELLLRIDRSTPGAEQEADDILLMFLDSHPDIYNAWFAFEPGVFRENSRFTKSYIQYTPGMVEEIFDMDDDILDDPEESPWYNFPLSTGELFLDGLDYYDYGDGGGNILTAAVTYPIIQKDGRIIGCVGFDVLLGDSAFQLISQFEIENERKILIISEDGTIIYSGSNEEIGADMSDYPFEDIDRIFQAMEEDAGFTEEGYSPFYNKKSLLGLYPISVESNRSRSYFYMDMPVDALHKDADRTTRMIGCASIASLILAVIILFIIAKNIVRPIRSITESAHKIAGGDADGVVLYAVNENEKTNNEVHILGAAINKMLLQLNETQKLKLETLELKHKKEKAETEAQAKGDFLARMSHEIRTPMNAIIGITELVLREEISPAVYEHVRGIKNAGSNLLSIINDILDFSKIESGKLEIIPTEYIFASLINDVINIIRIRTAENPVFFVVNLDSAIPSNLVGDEVRVRQILLNLLSNAVKYTVEGFISLTIDGEMREDNTVLLNIEVSDSGIGIRPEDINKLFGDFVQVDMASHKGIQGTGLGLAITRSLCLAMGGDISVYSEYGQGSTFTVRLPQKFHEYEKFASVENPSEKKVLLYEPRGIYADSIACSIDNLGVECVLVREREKFYEALKSTVYPFVFVSSFLFKDTKKMVRELGVSPNLVLLAEYGEVDAEKNIKTIAMPVHSISIANILNDVTDSAGYGGSEDVGITFSATTARVLIVDDISTNLKVAEGLMAPYNMRIDTCMSGEAAIEMVKSDEYDLIFMDHMMPEMDGVEATRRIRALGGEYYSRLPIIALTANAISGVKEMFIQNGMNDFLAKPIETSKLNSILEQWIPREKKEKQLARTARYSPAPFKINGLDVNAGIAATGGDTGHYIATLSLFCKDSAEKTGQIRDSMENEDMRLYVTYVHALKSALYSIGARGLSELARNLEAAGRNGDTDYIAQNTAAFLHDLEILLENIGKTVSEIKNSNPVQDIIDKTMLIRLKQALDEMDGITIEDVINRLRSQKLGEELNDMVEDIYQNILLLEYDEAQSVIDRLLNQLEGL